MLTSIDDSETFADLGKRLSHAREHRLKHYWDDKYPNQWTNHRGEGRRWPGGRKRRYFWGLTPEEYEIVSEVEERTGAELCGVGASRVIFDTYDDLVVKLPRWGVSSVMGDGIGQNHCEARAWEEVGEWPLLPVVEYHPDGWWLAMPRVKRCGAVEPHNDEPIDRIKRELEGMPNVRETDVKRANIGWDGEEWRIFDYEMNPLY